MKRILLILLTTAAFTSAETTENLIDQLRVAVTAEAREARNASDPLVQQRTYQWQQLLAQLYRDSDDAGSALELLRALQATEASGSSEKVAALCRALSTQMRNEQEKKDAALADEMEKVLAEALRSALAAKSYKDVDGPLASVHKYTERPRSEISSNVKLRKLSEQSQQLWQFLRQWQDYLAGVDSGQGDTPLRRLQNLLSSGSDFSNLVPRSEMLERLVGEKKGNGALADKKLTQEDLDNGARDILAATHTLDDVPESIRRLQDLLSQKSGGGYSMGGSAALTSLSNIERIRRDLDKGLSTSMNLANVVQNNRSDMEQLLSPVRAQLLLYAAPRLLNAGEADKPQAGETVPGYLYRMATVARDRADWTMLQRALEVTQSFNIEPTATSNDRAALQSFLVGLNQERAQQFAFAVASYEAALKAGSQLISAEIIGEHLEKIRKEHPEEYQQGVQMSLNAPPAALVPRTGRLKP